MQKNLTTGSVFQNILFFSLPYLLSYFLQTLYGMADLFIIGQFEGVADTTAVSIGSQVMHMLTVMLVGLAMGSTVSIGQAVGGRKDRQAAVCIGNTVTLFMGLSLVLTVVLLAASGADCEGDVHACPGGFRDSGLSDHLLYGNSLYHGLQHHQLYFSGNGGFQKPHVLYRCGLRGQYRAGQHAI